MSLRSDTIAFMQCEFVNVTTMDGVELQGLIFAPKGADTVGVWVHGLTASFHSNPTRTNALAKVFNSAGLAYATFDTRGHDAVAFARKYDKRKPKGYRSITVGAGYEKFTDCVLDLDAIVDFLHERFKDVIFIGHSTGANKAVYYLSRMGKQKKIAGVVLASPVSDVALYKKELGNKYEKALEAAQDMVDKGEGDKLMPQELANGLATASRFLSLADQNSVEQMFPTKEFRGPLTLFSKIKIPMLVLFGEKDDYLLGDKVTTQDVLGTFSKYHKSKNFQTLIIPLADHGYRDHDLDLGHTLVRWVQDLA